MASQALNKQSFLFSIFVPFFCIYICLQSLFPNLERTLFWGEGLALVLLCGSMKIFYQIELQKKIILAIYCWVFLVFFYSLWMSFTVWSDKTVFYFFIRHAVFFYYGFFFFAGYKWGPIFLEWFDKYLTLLIIFVMFKFFVLGGISIGFSVFFGLLWLAAMKKYDKNWIFWIGAVFLIYANYTTPNGTNKIIAYSIISLPFFIFFLKLWKTYQPAFVQKWLFRFFLLAILLAIGFGALKLSGLVFQMMGVGGIIDNLPATPRRGGALNPIEDFFDHNALWRLVFWAYLLSRFFEHPFGIGLGTPLYDPQIAYFLHMPTQLGDEYVIPAHNFFLTLLVRLGIPFLIFFFVFGFYIMRLFVDYLALVHFKPLDALKSRIVFGSFLVFLISFILASFNVVIESPLAAWFFWLTLGLFVRLCGDYTYEMHQKNTVERVS